MLILVLVLLMSVRLILVVMVAFVIVILTLLRQHAHSLLLTVVFLVLVLYVVLSLSVSGIITHALLRPLVVVTIVLTLLQLIPRTVVHKKMKLHALALSSPTTVPGVLLLILQPAFARTVHLQLMLALRYHLPVPLPSQ